MEPKLDLAELGRMAAHLRTLPPVPAKLQVSPQAMTKLSVRADVVCLHLGVPIEVNPWLGEGQWLALDHDERVIMINGTRVDPIPTRPEPDIYGGLAGEGLSYPMWLR